MNEYYGDGIGRVVARIGQEKVVEYGPGQPCSHPGCVCHLSHPCELCGRIAARGYSWISAAKVEAARALFKKRVS